MRHSPLFRLVLLSLALWLAPVANAEEPVRNRVLETFRTYEQLHADFLYKRGGTQEDLRSAVEAYAEGPFETALGLAQTQVCNFKDAEIVNALFRVKLATSGSANESPDWTLGYMFLCQPDLVTKSFKALPLSKQQALYSDFEFGFENVVYDKPKDDKRVLELRRKLLALEPSWKR